MKALIHKDRIVQVAEEEFPVHASMHWVDLPKDLDTKEPVLVESQDIFEEREVVDEETGEVVTRPVFVRKEFTLTQDTKAIEDRNTERQEQLAKEVAMREAKYAIRDFRFQGASIVALRTELAEFQEKIKVVLNLET